MASPEYLKAVNNPEDLTLRDVSIVFSYFISADSIIKTQCPIRDPHTHRACSPFEISPCCGNG